MTVRELIKKSAVLAGIIDPSETMSADESSDGLTSLNEMIDSWSNDGLLLYKYEQSSLAFTSGESSKAYSQTPEHIQSAMLVLPNTSPAVETEIGILSPKEWSELKTKALTGQIQKIFIQRTATGANILPWPVPDASMTVNLYRLTALSSFSTLDDAISVPAGYIRAIRYNLAIELSLEYGKEINPRVDKVAGESLGDLKRQNMKPLLLKSDAFAMSRGKSFNITTGN